MGMSEHVLATHPGAASRRWPTCAQAKAARHAELRLVRQRHLGAPGSGEMLKLQMGVDIVHMPYKGQAPRTHRPARRPGDDDVRQLARVPQPHRERQARALGMATAQRSQYAPHIPTLAEQGVPIESNSWNGLLAPAGTPDAVVQRMNAEVNRALAGPVATEAFHKGGIASLSGTPERFAAFIQSEIAKYGDVIRKANIQLEG
jgi:tripartite-type tricarboxylate transporter receptor subunit TctC